MSDGLEAHPRLNPAFMLFASSASDKMKKPYTGGIPLWGYIVAILVLYFCFRYYNQVYWTLESPANIRARLREFVNKYNVYGDQRSSRRSLIQYLEGLRKLGIPDTHFALTNFYVCSANTAATFTPMRDGIVSPEAIKLVLAAGARYLDFTIWPGGRTSNYRPYITEMDAGSNWRRLPMNELTFRAAMDTVQQYGIAGPNASPDTSEAPYSSDPLFIMLRFMGPTKRETYDQVADAFRNTIEAYRLDFTYYKARGMDKLFKTPITEFARKVIIMTNKYPPVESALNDYINVGPRGTLPLEMSTREVDGIPEENKAALRAKIQQNLVITRMQMEEPFGDKNDWKFANAHSLGIHFAAMNFWSQDANLAAYRKPDMFGVNSFKIKPAEMRYIIEYAKPPLLPNPELNARDGKPRPPTNISFPA